MEAIQMPQHWKTWLENYCYEISNGERRALWVQDFGRNLSIKFQDGSTCHFKHAIGAKDSTRGEIAVFTEHNGYHVFWIDSIESVGASKYIVLPPASTPE